MAEDVKLTVEAIDSASEVLARIVNGLRAITTASSATTTSASDAFDALFTSTTKVADSTQTVTDGLTAMADPLTQAGDAATVLSTGLDDTAESAKETAAQVVPVVQTMQDLRTAMDKTFGSLIAYIKQATLAAAETQMFGTALRVAATNAGYTSDQIVATESGIMKLGIATAEARKIMTGFIQSQLDVTQASGLARAAQDLAVNAQMSSSDAAAKLTMAIGRQSSEMLRSFGLVSTSEQIFEKYARSLNRTVDSLTQAERKQAFLNEIMSFAAGAAGTYEAAMEDVGKQYKSMARYQDEAALSIGSIFLPVMKVVVQTMTDFYKWLSDLGPAMKVVIGTVGIFAGVLSAVVGVVITMIGVKTAWTFAWNKLNASINAAIKAQAQQIAVTVGSVPPMLASTAAAGVLTRAMAWLTAAVGTATGGLSILLGVLATVAAAWLGYQNTMTAGDDAAKVADKFLAQRDAMAALRKEMLENYNAATTDAEAQKALTDAHDKAADILKTKLIPEFKNLGDTVAFFDLTVKAKEMAQLAAESASLREALHAEHKTLDDLVASYNKSSEADRARIKRLIDIGAIQSTLAAETKKRLADAAMEEESKKKFDELSGKQILTTQQLTIATAKSNAEYLLMAKRITDAEAASRKGVAVVTEAARAAAALAKEQRTATKAVEESHTVWQNIGTLLANSVINRLLEVKVLLTEVWGVFKSMPGAMVDWTSHVTKMAQALGKFFENIPGMKAFFDQLKLGFKVTKQVMSDGLASWGEGVGKSLDQAAKQSQQYQASLKTAGHGAPDSYEKLSPAAQQKADAEKKATEETKKATAVEEELRKAREKAWEENPIPAAAALQVAALLTMQAALRAESKDLTDNQQHMLAVGQAHQEVAKIIATPTLADGLAKIAEMVKQMGGATKLTREQLVALLPTLEAAFGRAAVEGRALDTETANMLARARAANITVKAISELDAAYQSMAKSLRPGVDTLAVLTTQFARLSTAQQGSLEAQRVLIPEVEKANEEHRKIAPTLLAAYDAFQKKTQAQVADGVASVTSQGLSEQMIQVWLASGKTLGALAVKYGVTTAAIGQYRDGLKDAKDAEEAIEASRRAALAASESGDVLTAALETKRKLRDFDLDTVKELEKLRLSTTGNKDQVAILLAKAQELSAKRLQIIREGGLAEYNERADEAEKEYALAEQQAALLNEVWEGSSRQKQAIEERDYQRDLRRLEREFQNGSKTAVADIARLEDLHATKMKLAGDAADTIVLRMKKEGYETAKIYAGQAADAKKAYQQMVESHAYSKDELNKKRAEWLELERKAGKEWLTLWGQAYGALAQGMNALGAKSNTLVAQMSQGLGAAANVMAAMQAATTSGFGTGSNWAQAKGVGGKLQAGMGMATQATAGIGAFMQSQQAGTQGARVLGGAQAGAQVGAVFGPWGVAIGAAIGAIAGLVSSNPMWKQVSDAVKAKFGTAISDGLAKAIDTDAAKFGNSVHAAMIFNMDKIVAEGGGLKSENLAKYTLELRNTFSMLEMGKFTLVQARETLDKNFGMFADQLQKSGKIASKEFLELFDLNKKFKTESVEMQKFVSEQTSRFATAMSTVLVDTLSQIGDPSTAEAVQKLGATAASEADKLTKMREELATLTGGAGPGMSGVMGGPGAPRPAPRLDDAQRKRVMELTEAIGDQEKASKNANTEYDKARAITKDMYVVVQSDIALSERKIAQYRQEIQLLKDKGGSEKEIAALERKMAGEQANLGTLVETRTKVSAKALEDLNRASRLVAAGFNAAVKQGLSWTDAVAQMSQPLDGIIAGYKALGQELPDSVKELVKFKTLVSDNKGLVDSAGAINEVALSLSNIGGMTEETLKDIEDQGLDTFKRLTTAGFSESQSLMQMKGWLTSVRDAHKQLGVPIDENTQKLIDQATEQGILADESNSTNAILKDGIGALITALGGQLPDAWTKAAKAAEDAARRMSDKTKEVTNAVGDVGGELDSAGQGFIEWADTAEGAAQRAKDAVDAVSFGESPGGIKEIPLKLIEAMAEAKRFAATMATEMEAAKTSVEEIGTAGVFGFPAEELDRFTENMTQAREAVRSGMSGGFGFPSPLEDLALAPGDKMTADAIRQQMEQQRELSTLAVEPIPPQPINIVLQSWDAEDVAKRGIPQIIKALKGNAFHQMPKFKDALGLT